MDTEWRHDRHREMRRLGLNRAAEVVVRRNHGGAGKDSSRFEIIIAGERRVRCAGRRMREVGKTELLGDCVGDVDIWRLPMLQMVLDRLDE